MAFLVYCCFKRFNPKIYSKVVIPGIVTGIMFGIGTGMQLLCHYIIIHSVCIAMWFLSNKFVGLPVAFPIITSVRE